MQIAAMMSDAADDTDHIREVGELAMYAGKYRSGVCVLGPIVYSVRLNSRSFV